MSPQTLVFEEFGQADKPPLVILHGFLASARNWRRIAGQLASEFHVYAPDLRNHGASPHDPVLDYPAMACDLLAFLDARKIASTALLGHSMGGKVSMWFALHYPERVARLVVADIAPITYTQGFDTIIGALKNLPLTQISSRQHADDLLAQTLPEQSFRQFLLQNMILTDGRYRWRIDLDIIGRAAHAITGFPDTETLLPFSDNALFIAGANSDYLDERAIRPLFPKASVITIADAGHWLHVEQPAEFIQSVAAFCRRYDE
ncbi:MAG: alpha/beta hydrolase [Gammaproteobacteria bacterium HGW-Gammaproteobacteria-3]|nr:MAG: alpha/beta hydrolase [Gammaproteobacteria bacterium HGW-Gammaproteobacteria-3]